jgi:hypothetical protein
MKKTTPPKSGIMKYAPVTTKKKATTGSTTSVASKGAATIKKQPVTSKKPAPAKKLPAKTNAPATGKGVTNLPEVTVKAKRITPATKPATTTTTSKKPMYTGNPNVTYVTKDKNNKNVEVTYDEYRKTKGPKTEIKNDASGYPVIQGSGGSRYRDYTPLSGKKYTGKDMFKPTKNK